MRTIALSQSEQAPPTHADDMQKKLAPLAKKEARSAR